MYSLFRIKLYTMSILGKVLKGYVLAGEKVLKKRWHVKVDGCGGGGKHQYLWLVHDAFSIARCSPKKICVKKSWMAKGFLVPPPCLILNSSTHTWAGWWLRGPGPGGTRNSTPEMGQNLKPKFLYPIGIIPNTFHDFQKKFQKWHFWKLQKFCILADVHSHIYTVCIV